MYSSTSNISHYRLNQGFARKWIPLKRERQNLAVYKCVVLQVPN